MADVLLRQAIKRLAFLAVASTMLFVTPTTRAATGDDVTIYRCTDAKGHLALRDTPCRKGETQETRSMLRPKDSNVPVPVAAPTPRVAQPETPGSPRVIMVTTPQPLYQCITPDGDSYTSESPEGRPRWVPLWTLGYPGYRSYGGYGGSTTTSSIEINNGNVHIQSGTSVGDGYLPPVYGAAGTWIRDACHALPQQEVCARLIDQRDEIRRRFFNAQQTERDRLSIEERGINARLDSDCGGH